MFNFGFMISGSFLVPFFCYRFFGEMGEILRLKQEKEYRDECLAILKSAGFADASHVSGGVVAWAKQIDTSLPVY